MDIPRIEIFLDEKTAVLICRHRRQDAQQPLQIELSLSHLFDLGFTTAAHEIGSAILKAISLWHPEMVGGFGGLCPPYEVKDDIEMLEHLIEKSLKTKTRGHLDMIEQLIGNVLARAPDHADERIRRRWQSAVKTIQKF